ncbi:hypothetical protein GN958_ATG23120 [Phytophthora infestans]|uniref:Uncharacterized protein n=1 Tax=Phytophthora infestans TaxID=4787 RepID=A0A8S9TM78_PHYIN|nr:hypothetical protein GN958_ATG23120 [Phytophthora infestans]
MASSAPSTSSRPVLPPQWLETFDSSPPVFFVTIADSPGPRRGSDDTRLPPDAPDTCVDPPALVPPLLRPARPHPALSPPLLETCFISTSKP